MSTDNPVQLPAPNPPMSVNVPAQMVLELAMGMEDPLEIIKRYDVSEQQFRALENQEWFVKAYLRKVADLKEGGFLFREQARFFAEDLGKDLYMRAKSPTATLPQVQAAYQTFSRMGDLEPKTDLRQNAPGAGFTINIVLPDKKNEEKVVIEHGKDPTLPKH